MQVLREERYALDGRQGLCSLLKGTGMSTGANLQVGEAMNWLKQGKQAPRPLAGSCVGGHTAATKRKRR